MNNIIYFAIIAYLALISLITIVITVADKINAGKNKRRVPEKTLILLALFGGSFAEYLTMKIIRHKTLHAKFMVGLPFIIVLQLSGTIFAYLYFFTDIFTK